MASEDKEQKRIKKLQKERLRDAERRGIELHDEEDEAENGPVWGYSNWFVLGLIVITAIFVILMIFG